VNALFLAGVFVVAVVLDLGLMAWYRRRLRRKGLYPKAGESDVIMLGGYSPLLSWILSLNRDLHSDFSGTVSKVVPWLRIPDSDRDENQSSDASRGKSNILIRWTQIQPIILLVVISVLAFIPAYLVFLNRWFDYKDLLPELDSLWCKSTFLCETAFPGYFLLVYVCILGLIVMVWVHNRKYPTKLSFNFKFQRENLEYPFRHNHWMLNLSFALLAASLLAALTSFSIGLATNTVPGIGFIVAFAFYAAGWLVQVEPFKERKPSNRMDRNTLLAFLLMHVALLNFLASLYGPTGLAWGPTILLILSIANLSRYVQKIPWVLWLVTLSILFFTIDINHWAFSIIGDEYSFYTYALEITERHNLLQIGQRLFDGNAVYGAHPYLSSLLQAISMQLFGRNNFGWRFSSLYLSAWSIALFFLFFRHFIGRFQALLASAFLAGSAYIMSFGKVGYNNLQALFAMALVLAVAGWMVRSKRWISAVSLGFSMGFCFYVYPAALYILPLPVLLMLFYDLPKTSRAKMRWVVTFFTFGYSLLPVLLQPNYWQSKIAGLFVNDPQIVVNSTNFIQHLLSNFLIAISSYLFIPEESHYVVSAYQDPLSAIFVSLGLALCLIHFRKERFIQFFLAGFIALLILVGATHDRRFPPTTRMFLLLPWFAVLATFGFSWLVKQSRNNFGFRLGRKQILLSGLLIIYGLNLYQAYPLSISRTAGLQSFEVLFLRLTQQIQQHDRGQMLLPHTVLFLMDSSLNLDGFNMVQEVYQIPENSVQLQRLELDGPEIPDAALPWIYDQNSLVVLQPTLDKIWYQAVGDSLEASGKHACAVQAVDGLIRFQFFYSDQMSWTCEEN
jgi:Dolichyl-phosphate-mannose-protein mannosyltransferase